MTGDRKLTDAEKKAFIDHKFNALETIVNGGGEPTLYEVALIEVSGKLDALTGVLVHTNTRISRLIRNK